MDFEHITVTFPGGRTAVYDAPLLLQDLSSCAELQPSDTSGPVMALRVNGLVMSFQRRISIQHISVQPVYLSSTEGASIYRRSLVFVMAAAANREFGKDWLVIVEHSLHGAYFCTVNKGKTVSEEEVGQLYAQMTKLVGEDLPIEERVISWADACTYFREANRPYSLSYVETTNQDDVVVNHCGGFMSLRLRALASSTGALSKFDLFRVQDGTGFALHWPDGKNAAVPLSPKREVIEDPVMEAVYREYNGWGRLLGVECTGDMNKKITANESKTFVAMSEALHNHKIVEIAMKMQERMDKLRMVLIAGPSASGKTTFAGKLSIQLQIMGLTPVVLSVDNYYRPRAEMPRDENGDIDFEAVEALRVETLNDHLVRLLRGETVEAPIFDFHLGVPKRETIRVTLPPNGILVMEGIHMLNDRMTQQVPREAKFKIFLAPLSQLNLDECNFSSHEITRMIRRTNRDYNHRGYTATDTLGRFPSVVRGEEKHIFPFMKTADVVFNTALDYEICVLKTYVAPLFRTIKPGDELYNNARNLMDVLDMFFPIPHDNVPPNSLLREFVGGSFFE